MFCGVILLTLFAASCGQKELTDDLETLRNNAKTKQDFKDNVTDLCGPFVNEKPNFTAPGRRISEEKCLEYIWEMENREKKEEWNAKCQLYLMAEIKKGTILFPQVSSTFVQISAPVKNERSGSARSEFPHMGALGWPAKNATEKWVFKCSSTLISEKFLITAAHCSTLSVRRIRDIARSEPEIVRLGVENIAYSYNELNMGGIPVDMKIRRIIVYTKYSPPEKYFDIALIELETEVIFTNKLQPACIWGERDVNRLGNKGTLTGWGQTYKGEFSPLLQAADVYFIDTPSCDNTLTIYRNRHWHGVRQHQICAGKLQGGMNTCQGYIPKSGGPLQVRIPTKSEGKIYWTVAVTSFGYKCGFNNIPGVYTRISSFINWIEEIVWGSKS